MTKADEIAAFVAAKLARVRGAPLTAGAPGWIVEAGAFDGATNSNSAALEAMAGRGWRSVLVEPVPEMAAACRANRPRAIVAECALGNPDRGDARQFVAFDGERGELSGWCAAGQPVPDGGRVVVPAVRRLSDLLAEIGAPPVLDALFLDLEGAEAEALAHHDFAAYRFRAAVVEHNGDAGRRAAVKDRLEGAGGMVRIATGGHDDFYLERQAVETVAPRPYPVRVPKVASSAIMETVPAMLKLPTHNGRRHFRLSDPIVQRDLADNGGRGAFLAFGFVRHPYDRAVSLYHWLRRRRGDALDRSDGYCAGLAEFASMTDCATFWQRVHLPTAQALSRMFDPQWMFLEGADFVGRWETLARDWRTVAERCDLPPVLARANVSEGRGHWKDELNGNAQLRIAEHYREDFRRFGYET